MHCVMKWWVGCSLIALVKGLAAAVGKTECGVVLLIVGSAVVSGGFQKNMTYEQYTRVFNYSSKGNPTLKLQYLVCSIWG